MHKRRMAGAGVVALTTVMALTSSTTASSGDSGVNSGGVSARALTNCHSTHTIGTGVYGFRTCFTKDGNVLMFEVANPAGTAPGEREHIRVGGFAEGYVLCSIAGVHGYDYGLAELGFNAATKSQPNGPNTLPLKITRTTADGFFTLVQRFQVQSRRVTVSTTVKNRTGSPITDVFLSRVIDADVDADIGDDMASTDNRSARAWDNPSGGSLSLGAPTSNRAAVTSLGSASAGDFTSCAALPGVSVKGPGDQTLKATYALGTLNAGQTSKAVSFVITGS